MVFLWIPTVFLTLLVLFFAVKQQSVAIIEPFGKFLSIRHSGLLMKIPLINRMARRIRLMIQQLNVHVENKTLNNVFVQLKISVPFLSFHKKYMIHFINQMMPMPG